MTQAVHIFTDLDGTLLGHDDYAFEPVVPVLRALEAGDVGVSLATSKTLPEVLKWQARLQLQTPFIVENGAAVYFPERGYDLAGLEVTPHDGWLRVTLGANLEELEVFLSPFRDRVLSLAHCSLADAVRVTDLPTDDAALAQQRSHTLPLIAGDDEVFAEIVAAAPAAGLMTQQGGRFLHVQGDADKGRALELVRIVLDRTRGVAHRTIALGDSGNDIELLRAADVAVVMNTHAGHRISLDGDAVIRTERLAPDGWVEGVREALTVIMA